jgi:hypothetical protein
MAKKLLGYWGYLALAAAIAGWVTHTFTIVVILVLAAAAALYFLLETPVWCGAITRTGQLCRNNAHGVLLGCHLREHKWQKIRMVFAVRGWHVINQGLWSSPKDILATLGSLVSIGTVLAAAIAQLIKVA